MKVIVADKSGFCPGVRNAIRLAEQALQERGCLYSLGPIIHNNDVVRRLASKGLRTVNSVDQIDSGTVLIRSHGAAPDQIDMLKRRGLKIVDATCVLVKRLQKIASHLCEQGYKLVIIGDRNHPEVKAVIGSAPGATVIAAESDINVLPKDAKLGVVCQTTQDPSYFGQMLRALCVHGFSELKAVNTLCKEAIERQKSAVELCKKVDVMFVLGGLESANTCKLAELCRKYNPNTYHLQNLSELDKTMLRAKETAGVTAGASTPEWVISEFVEFLRSC